MFVIHTERVIGSKMPSQCGLSTRVRESPRTPRTEFSRRDGDSINSRGKGLAYNLLISALLAPPLLPEDLLGPLELGVMRDMVIERKKCGITEINDDSDTATREQRRRCRRGCQRSPVDLHSATSSSLTMSDRRRAEIEAKRAKLAELRRAREDRQRQSERRISEVRSPNGVYAVQVLRSWNPLHLASRLQLSQLDEMLMTSLLLWSVVPVAVDEPAVTRHPLNPYLVHQHFRIRFSCPAPLDCRCLGE